MDTKIFEGLPLGVSSQILDAIQEIAKPVAQYKEQIWNGFNIILNTSYPLKLQDGTIIDGVMVGDSGSRCYLIREKNNGAN
jgi:hypothetical protein